MLQKEARTEMGRPHDHSKKLRTFRAEASGEVQLTTDRTFHLRRVRVPRVIRDNVVDSVATILPSLPSGDNDFRLPGNRPCAGKGPTGPS